MKTKSRELGLIKAGPDDGLAEGQFWAYASVFGNKDSYGDVVEPGAFAETLKAWKLKGNPIPLLYMHNNADPDYFIGQVLEAAEDEVGLKVLCQIDLGSPKGATVHNLVKSGLLAQMSFMYDVQEGEWIEPIVDGKASYKDAYFSLKELKLYEVSVVHIGANQETSILDVKSAADALRVKAGKALSAKTETAIREVVGQLEGAVDALKGVLPAEEEPEEEPEAEEETEKASAPTESKAAALVRVMQLEEIA